MTQTDRVLRALRRGPISPVDFQAPARDGHKPILRVAARINELRAAGHHITSQRQPNGTATYTLVGDVERGDGLLPEATQAPCSPPAASAIATLGTTPAMYDVEAA